MGCRLPYQIGSAFSRVSRKALAHARMASYGTRQQKLAVEKSLALYLAITTVVQQLLSLGRSRLAAMRTSSFGRSPRMIGQ